LTKDNIEREYAKFELDFKVEPDRIPKWFIISVIFFNPKASNSRDWVVTAGIQLLKMSGDLTTDPSFYSTKEKVIEELKTLIFLLFFQNTKNKNLKYGTVNILIFQLTLFIQTFFISIST